MSTTKKNTINVVTVCDNNYVVLLAALLKSLERNIDDGHCIDFYIVEDNISEKNKWKIHDSIRCENIHIKWMLLDSVMPDNFILPVDASTYPLNIYVRLFIPYFLPAHVDKVIYLDVDMIVLKDLFNLWKTDLNGHTIAAVHDTFDTAYYGIKNYKELGISKDSKYFNSGLLIIDAIQWRNDNITEKLIKCLSENKAYASYPDQYGLNVIFADKWCELDLRWNTFTYQDVNDPFIVHFIGYKPIYKDYDGKPKYHEMFYSYLNQTAWKGYSPKSKYSRYWVKLKTKTKKLVYAVKTNQKQLS